MALNFPANPNDGDIYEGYEYSSATGAWLPISTVPSDSFTTIQTPSGTNPVADGVADTLTFIAGSGLTITGDESNDSVTIASTINSFSTFKITDSETLYADGPADAVTFNSGSGISITGNATGDSLTISATATPPLHPFLLLGS